MVGWHQRPLLSASSSQRLKIRNNFEDASNRGAEKLIEEYKDEFEGLGRLKGEVEFCVAEERTGRQMPILCIELLKKEIEEMENMGRSPYNNKRARSHRQDK